MALATEAGQGDPRFRGRRRVVFRHAESTLVSSEWGRPGGSREPLGGHWATVRGEGGKAPSPRGQRRVKVAGTVQQEEVLAGCLEGCSQI